MGKEGWPVATREELKQLIDGMPDDTCCAAMAYGGDVKLPREIGLAPNTGRAQLCALGGDNASSVWGHRLGGSEGRGVD